MDDENELREIKNILWGSSIKKDVFINWSQGRFIRLFIIS